MTSTLPNHSELSKLARENPEALEALRQREIDQLIAGAPAEYQRRLRGLQFQIDSKRQLHSNPMGACIEISRMMMQSVAKLREALEAEPGSEAVSSKAATVLSFNSRSQSA
ncbi:DUF3135 domain-containing protein [Agaribacterium haliotis]|uniref:DUF3135 domain-containing protein n=1 Tax=Agaribacterium haliotis TaxID=2013869 RepID=UPI000BB5397A|nr:DUF3135 domain-containing protein [Agaribacterium haliotis]